MYTLCWWCDISGGCVAYVSGLRDEVVFVEDVAPVGL